MVTGIVEQVRDGTTVRVRLFDGDVHQFVNVSMAAVRSPKPSKQGEPAEQWGDEVSIVSPRTPIKS
jgi:hypothetical protein